MLIWSLLHYFNCIDHHVHFSSCFVGLQFLYDDVFHLHKSYQLLKTSRGSCLNSFYFMSNYEILISWLNKLKKVHLTWILVVNTFQWSTGEKMTVKMTVLFIVTTKETSKRAKDDIIHLRFVMSSNIKYWNGISDFKLQPRCRKFILVEFGRQLQQLLLLMIIIMMMIIIIMMMIIVSLTAEVAIIVLYTYRQNWWFF